MISYRNPALQYGPMLPKQDFDEPVPGWGMNPMWSGPAYVGIGTVPLNRPNPLPSLLLAAVLWGGTGAGIGAGVGAVAKKPVKKYALIGAGVAAGTGVALGLYIRWAFTSAFKSG
jgi:hypothetical protein